MLLRPITCAPPFQHCDHMSFLCLSPCPSSLTCPFSVSHCLIRSLIPVLHIFKSARQSLHAIVPIMLQPLNMYLMKDSFSPQEFYFLHSDVGKRRSCGRPTWKIVTTHLCIHGRLWASFQFFHVIFQDILHSWGPRGTIAEFSYNCDVDTNSSQ